MTKEKTLGKASKRRSKRSLDKKGKRTHITVKHGSKRLSWASRAILWLKTSIWRRNIKRKG